MYELTQFTPLGCLPVAPGPLMCLAHGPHSAQRDLHDHSGGMAKCIAGFRHRCHANTPDVRCPAGPRPASMCGCA